MMEIDDEEILQGLAAGRPMDYSAWPALLPLVIARIEKIAHEEFPIPNLPPPPPPPAPLSSATTLPSSVPRASDSDLPESFLTPLPSSPTEPEPGLSSLSSDTNKENNPAAPQTTTTAAAAAATTTTATTATTTTTTTTGTSSLPPPPTSVPATTTTTTTTPTPPLSDTLPPQFTCMLSEITSHLKSTFPTYPPHTIQRISELVIQPKQHYRSLATYLHALDRVVHVTSGLNIYPLPLAHAEISGGLANGVLEAPSRLSSWASPGSDEALGGALLTPIPWITHGQRPTAGLTAQPSQLSQAQQAQQAQSAVSSQDVTTEFEGEVRTESTERIDGPNGVGSIETVSVSVNGIPSMGARGVSVTQGELLRQEQEAGLVPVSQLVPSHHIQLGPNASAAAQQQIQARIHQQRALAQSQDQARALSSAELPDSLSSASNTSTPSSATLEGEGVDAAADNALGAIESVHSNNAEDDEKPHARGPEEIGADDLGPQTTSSSTLAVSATTGAVRQGIDIQAAVGRKPLDVSAPSTSEEEARDHPGDDKMDVAENGRGSRPATPKRDAEEQLGGSASKKLKEDSSPTPADGSPKSTEDAKPGGEEDGHVDAMDKD